MNTKGRETSWNYVFFLGVILLSACVVGQQWSENYSLMDGVRSNDPVIIDGDLKTVGQSQIKKGSGSLDLDIRNNSESVIILPEKKKIYRVVIHSSNLKDFQLMALNTQDKWDLIHDHQDNKEDVVDIRLKRSVTTDGIKLVVRQTSDDSARRRQNIRYERENEMTSGGNVRRGRHVYKISGPLTAPANIAEIKLFGYADAAP